MATTFPQIAAEFHHRVSSTVWATISSVNARGQTRVRVMHPIWQHREGDPAPTGWVGTARHGSLSRHLASNQHLSVAYVHTTTDPMHTSQLYADCTAEWVETAQERQHVWDLLSSTPEPYGFDPATTWQRVDNPDFGFIRLTPWRIELASLGIEGWQQQIWRPTT